MTEPKKRRTFAEWCRNTLIIYILPICIIGYVNNTKCWPYQALEDFSKGSMAERHAWVNDDIIRTVSVIILAGTLYGFRYLYKKMFR